jgi:uncharacterized protein YjbI with pentapeptide repeats
MANELHLSLLKQGVDAWNQWRQEQWDNSIPVFPDLSKADLPQADLAGVNLSEANLKGANLKGAKFGMLSNLVGANLTGADLTGAFLARTYLSKAKLNGAKLNGACLVEANLNEAKLTKANLNRVDLTQADLIEAKLNGANLTEASLIGANLTRADFIGANLTGADLTCATLVQTNFEQATIANCKIYGISAWHLNLRGANQLDLVITHPSEPTITVDNLEVAQFIHLLLYNEKIRHVIDTITSKVVLILGRFAPERKAVLDAIRNELRRRNYLPVLFDFEKPASRDITETISTLAHMARFVIADITDARSIPQELERIVPGLPSVPIQPLLQTSANEYGMFEHFKRYPWVLEILRYKDLDDLLKSLNRKVIVPAETKAKELRKG